jgi:hypothetical protein
MRKVFLLAALVLACAKKEAPPADTAAPAPPPPPPPPPALTAAEMKGTWNGTTKREGDTTTIAWTVTTVTDSTSKLTYAKNKQTVDFTTKYDADSMIAMSKPYNDPGLPKGTPKVVFRSVGRMKDGKLVGTATLMLASKPDSVLGKSTWEATKAP